MCTEIYWSRSLQLERPCECNNIPGYGGKMKALESLCATITPRHFQLTSQVAMVVQHLF